MSEDSSDSSFLTSPSAPGEAGIIENMMGSMKRIATFTVPLLLGLTVAAFSAFAQLSEATNVYILPMAGGLDQFLAQKLTEKGVLQVVTDASKADVIFTTMIGADFEKTLRDMYQPTPVEDQGKAGDEFARPSMKPLSSNRGNIFLVQRSTGNVLWSDFEPAGSSDSKDLDRAAEHIVDDLRKAREAN